MFNNKALYWLSMILVVIGGLNWGLYGLFHFDLVTTIFGGFARVIFFIIGLGAVFLIMNIIKTGGMNKAAAEIKKDIKPEQWKKDISKAAGKKESDETHTKPKQHEEKKDDNTQNNMKVEMPYVGPF